MSPGQDSRLKLIITIAKYSKAQEVQVTFSLYRIPSNIRVSFGDQQSTTTQTTTSQILHNLYEHIQKDQTSSISPKVRRDVEERKSNPSVRLTFSRSASVRASASSLLSMTEAAATSRGVDPLIEGDADKKKKNITFTLSTSVKMFKLKVIYGLNQISISMNIPSPTLLLSSR